MFKPTVCAVFNAAPEGEISLNFAADLFRLLGGDKLLIFIASRASIDPAMEALQLASVAEGAAVATGLELKQLEVKPYFSPAHIVFPPQAILIDPAPGMHRNEVNVLHPMDESGLEARGKGRPIMIPFGSEESGLHASQLGLDLAGALNREVLLYHTTWRNEKVPSHNPADHMCSSAIAVQKAIEENARVAGVRFKTIVETADDIVEGVVHCALRERACLIVTTRGLRIGLGSYAAHMLEQSPIPVLVAGRSAGA